MVKRPWKLSKVMVMNKVSIIGGSGHAKVIIDLAEVLGYEIEKVYDQDLQRKTLLSFKIEHSFKDVKENTIVAIGNNSIRKKITEEFQLNMPSMVHPKSTVSKFAEIGYGTVVMAGVSVNAEARIGKHCILNTNCSVDHDCIIRDYVHISPNVGIAGNVEIGECTHIGIGSNIIQGIKIGKNCVIGAGSVIIRDVEDGAVIVGNPGRRIR